MRKSYIEPIINISVFNSESIVTKSTGTIKPINEITKENYAIIRADWAPNGNQITFTF